MFAVRVVMRVSVRILTMVVVMVTFMRVPLAFLVLVMRVHSALVDAELDAFDVLPLLAIEVHVEIADFQFRKLPLQSGGLHAEIAQRANRHVAADAGGTIEEENFHGI